MTERSSVAAEIGSVAESVEKRFQRGRRVLSFSEYLDLFASDPQRHARCLRNPDRCLRTFLRRNAAEKSQVAAGRECWPQQVRWQSMIDSRDPVQVGSRSPLRLRDRDERRLAEAARQTGQISDI